MPDTAAASAAAAAPPSRSRPPTRVPFDAVIATYGATVLRVCRGLLGPHEAEDAWQETFLSALRAYPSLAVGANVEAWLVTIAHRKAIDALRTRSRHAVPAGAGTGAGAGEPADLLAVAVDRAASSRAAPGPSTPVGDEPDQVREARELWSVVASLPERQRQAVAYRYLGGITHAEVAAIVGVTPEAARRAASDGLRTLRTRLAQEPAQVPEHRATERSTR